MLIELPCVPPSQNVYKSLTWTRAGLRTLARKKREWELLIQPYGFIWRANYGKTYASQVKITFCFPDNRRRDRDNYTYWKAIPDGLVKADILRDDSVKDVDITYEIKLATGCSKTIIELTTQPQEKA